LQKVKKMTSPFKFFTTEELQKDLELFKTAHEKYKKPRSQFTDMIAEMEAEISRRLFNA
jgi:hypothetical protein